MANPIIANPNSTSATTVTVLNQDSEERVRAVYTGPLNTDVQGLYSLAILDMSNNDVAVVSSDNLDPAQRTQAAEYFFRVPPKQHEMTEPFATAVIATQNGGKFVESHGSIMKSIQLSGTTGLRPNPKVNPRQNIPLFGGGVDSALNSFQSLARGNFIGAGATRLAKEEATGYDDVVFLRNLFRHYSDLKSQSPKAKDILMVWRNAKDAEYWVVEPTNLKLTQDSSSPLTYKYVIQLKTLSKFTTSIQFAEDPRDNIMSTQRFLSRIQGFNTNLKKSFLQVSTLINRLEGYGVSAQTQIMTPIIEVIRGLSLVKNTTTQFGSKIIYNAAELTNNLDEAIADIQKHNLLTRDSLDIIRLFRRTQVTLAGILTEPSFRDNVETNSSGSISRSSRAYSTSGGSQLSPSQSPATGGSLSFIGNEQIPSAVAQTTVNSGEDIRGLAARILGDRSRWHILVTLNNLRAPYIASTRGPGVLSPGDHILYPSQDGRAVNAHALGNQDEDSDSALGPVQHVYGRDLLLSSVPTSSGGVDLTDIVVSQTGDLETVVGVPNVDQGVRLKFITERGEVPAHPTYGARFPLGSRGTPAAFNEFRIQTEATIYSDRRVRGIRRLNFNMTGDVISVAADIELLDSADVLDTSIALRRI